MNPREFGLVVEARTRACVVEVLLNDIPVGLCGQGVRRKLEMPVNEFVMDGVNELGIIVNPGDTPATARLAGSAEMSAFGAQPAPTPAMEGFLAQDEQAGGQETTLPEDTWDPPSDSLPEQRGVPLQPQARVTAMLSRYPVGATVGEGAGVPLIRLDWSARGVASSMRRQDQPFPLEIRKRQDIGPMFGRPAWRDADLLQLDDGMLSEIHELVLKTALSLEGGDGASVVAMSARKYEEVARAYGISADDRARLFERMIAEASSGDRWLFMTPEPDELSLRVCAEGRMVECVGTDWLPLVRTVRSGDGSFRLPMFVGKLGGEWAILR